MCYCFVERKVILFYSLITQSIEIIASSVVFLHKHGPIHKIPTDFQPMVEL